MASGKTIIFPDNDESIKEWKHYYKRIKRKGIYHSPEYINVLKEHSGNPAELFIFEINDNNFIYYPYFKRNLKKLPFAQHCTSLTSGYFDIDSSWYYGGPLVQSDNAKVTDELVAAFSMVFSEYCKASNIISEFIRFDPTLANHVYFENFLPVNKNRDAVYVDLTQSEDDIWMNMEGRARTAIRKAKKIGVEVHVSKNKEELLKFCEIYDLEMERKRAPSHYRFSRQFIIKLADAMGDRFQLIYAEIKGMFISAGIFLYEHGHPVHYFLMATHNDYQRYQANNLILFEAMLFFKSKGVPVFDLQGGREGVFKFKKSFSRSRSPFYTSGIVRNESVYNRLVTFKKEHYGLEEVNFFPLYRMKKTN